MKKIFKLNPKSTYKYLEVFNGVLKLTDKEMQVLAAFLDKHKELKDHGIDVFSTEVRKKIAKELGMENENTINIYVKNLKDKQAIRYIKGKYVFNPLLVRTEDEEGVTFLWTKKS